MLLVTVRKTLTMTRSKPMLIFSLAALLFTGRALAQASEYGQCGGQGWTGSTACPTGWVCQVSSTYYSQCLPGTSGSTSASVTTSVISSSPGSSYTATATSAAASGTTTLQPGYSFIRAVEDPYFHQYLQSQVLATASDAVLGSPATAAQFVINGGQLVQNAGATSLYAVVEGRANSSVMMLQMSWSTAPASGADAGTFTWSGDTLEWSIPTIDRPQTNAWYVCPDSAGNLDVYVNLGYYDYGTPAGCADETIHAYTGATATP